MQKRTFFKRLFVGLLLAIIVCMGFVIYRLQASLYAVQTALGDMLSIGHIQRCHMTVYGRICTIMFNDAVVAVAAAASAAGILPIVMGAGIWNSI